MDSTFLDLLEREFSQRKSLSYRLQRMRRFGKVLKKFPKYPCARTNARQPEFGARSPNMQVLDVHRENPKEFEGKINAYTIKVSLNNLVNSWLQV